ncbi:MAG: ACP S-malonyltransferase [Treponema sp.]|jgi:[acyl-carrier-protein] S-malonyltransferase|nr:ACP S-malonyltransferase [Treponema sp.]
MAYNHNHAVFLFPGQGAQYQGMGLDFWEQSEAVKTLFALASDTMKQDMKSLLADADEATLKRTDVSQPAITLVNLATAAFLAEQGVKPAGCAGFSLGEYAALAISGVITTEDCFRLVKARGESMQAAADALGHGDNAPGMAAVIGLAPERVEALLAEWHIEGLYAANINSPKQVVVSGTAAALKAAEPCFKAAGARRCLRLAVAGPFHSPLMGAAAAAFRPVLEGVVFKAPAIPLYSNVSGALVSSGAEAQALALRHITEAVRWTAEEAVIAAQGNVDAVLETGPGKVLHGLWKDAGGACAAIPCFGAGTVAEINNVLQSST